VLGLGIRPHQLPVAFCISSVFPPIQQVRPDALRFRVVRPSVRAYVLFSDLIVIDFSVWFTLCLIAFNPLTLLVGHQEEHPACKN